MLQLYRRHGTDCPHRSRRYRRCSCPIWVQGSLGGEYVRKALKQTSWEASENIIHEWRTAGEIKGKAQEIPTVRKAVASYLADAEARRLAPATMGKLKLTLDKQLLTWADSKGYTKLKQLDVDVLREFRGTWKGSPISALKKLERLRGFFRFCLASGWVKTNPAQAIKPPKITDPPTLPFSEDEIAKILKAIEKFPIVGRADKDWRVKLRALVLLLRFSGLRIGDAIYLTEDRIVDGKLILRTAKTGTVIYVPLPPIVIDELKKVPGLFKKEGKPKHVVGSYQRTFGKLCKLAGITNGHFHRLRDSFAVGLLLKGVPLSDVSILLGHSSIKVTEKSYAPWIKERQVRLEAAVMKTWD